MTPSKKEILEGGCMILTDDTLAGSRLFLRLFKENPQSLPQCYVGSVYQCQGGTWNVITPTQAQSTRLPIYKATELLNHVTA